MLSDFRTLAADLARQPNHHRVGRVSAVGTAAIEVSGLTHQARIGDQTAHGGVIVLGCFTVLVGG